MNPDQLLKYFDRISDAPDAVSRLRSFILELAVRGKLVEQDPRDEPASEILRRLRTKSRRQVQEGDIKNHKFPSEIREVEKPYLIPPSWQWVRLGECLDMINGRAFKPNDWLPAGLPIVRIQNLNNDKASFNYCDESIVEAKHIIESGCFLISWSGTPGTSFGAFIWSRGRAALNQHIFRCVQISDSYYDEFLRIAINGRLDEMIAKAHGGVGLQHITKGKLENLPLSLPPTAEQHRIVSKVNELMLLCDQLESVHHTRKIKRDSLTSASFHFLNNEEDAEAFSRHAHFCFGHFQRLTAHPEQIKYLRQTILNLSVRGKLTTQNPYDEQSSELLNRIKAEKVDLIGKTAVERESRESHLSEEGIPFAIPPAWQWTSLRSIIVFGPQNGISPKPSSRPDAPKAITLTATTKGFFDPNQFKRVDAMIPDESEFWLRSGDLLFQRGNTRDYVGMAAYYTGESGKFLYPDLMMKVRTSAKINLQYIHLCAVSPYARAYFSTHATGAQATMPKINQGILVKLPIPLPPLAEQDRIVAKAGNLMVLCDQLEAQLTSIQMESCRLLESVLYEALNRDPQVFDLEPARQAQGFSTAPLS